MPYTKLGSTGNKAELSSPAVTSSGLTEMNQKKKRKKNIILHKTANWRAVMKNRF